MKKENKKINTGTVAAIGAGVAALAAASYYLFGPEGKIHRKHAKGWMIKMKGEIIEKIEDAKEITEPIYHNIIDSVIAGYLASGKIGKEELEDAKMRLKKQWKHIAKSSKSNSKSLKKL